MARLPEQDVSGVRRAIRQGVQSRFCLIVTLMIGLAVFASTALRAASGMDPDEAAARGVADGIGAFTGLLAAFALMTINLSASRWYRSHVSEPWLERGERRCETVVATLKATSMDAGGRMGRRKRLLPSWWSWDRFDRFIEWLTYGTGLAFVLTVSWSVDRALLAAGGIESAVTPLAAVVLVGVPGVLSFTIFQTPLMVLTLRMYRLERMLGDAEQLLASGKPDASDRSWASTLQWPALVEPVVRRLGPISVPGWRQPQPDAR